MSISLEVSFASGLLSCEARGDFALDDAKRVFLEVLDAVGQYRAEKVFLDGRGLRGTPEVMERFFYGEFAANETSRVISERGLPRAPRFAYVLKEPVLDPRRFGENVAVNRGMIVKTFDNREEALAWLMELDGKV